MFLKMWQMQKELMEKFDQIEIQNNQMQIPAGQAVNLDCRFSQARIKDFSSRIAIEMAEATEALKRETLERYDEEMADVYHFILEILILSNIPPAFVLFGDKNFKEVFYLAEEDTGYKVEPANYPDHDLVRIYAYNVLEYLFLAMNELKAKPWKLTSKPTDKGKFAALMALMHHEFIKMCVVSGITAEDLYNSYVKKQETNVYRIANAE